ncbi:acetylxylan esterase [Telluribacter sp. SYSU D00476]|uniref:acetylxylan esterase n=1 Tax=Telluribacter sp. SYSU D00476 TaxID=2811430 RepID=UPI001FF56921|nr:acetylxylan esterase [Telluribacter sp. SYSU D00476]
MIPISKKLLLLCQTLMYLQGIAQPPPPERWVKVIVAPDRPDWTYKVGDKVKFNVQVLKSHVPMKDVLIRYEIGPEKMDPTIKQEVVLKAGETTLDGGTMKAPGFLRCTVWTTYEGKEYSAWTTAGFSPEQIQPTVTLPANFEQYWNQAKAENARIPMDPKMTLISERSTENVNVYHVSLQNWRSGARLYGILCVPKKEGKYPAVLKVPGAGIRPYYGDVGLAEQGIITFEIGIHGISVIMPQPNYDDLLSGWNNHYWTNNIHDKDNYFYKRVYLGCVRANDFIASLPQFDGRNLGVMGSSQGGALSIVTAALDPRVTCTAPIHPAMSDMTGYLHGRAGGWPHYLADQSKWTRPSHKDVLETVQYYDVVNFARFVKVPTFSSFGFNDNVCPPTSIYAALNVIRGEKTLMLARESAHWVFPEQQEAQNRWIINQLKK